MDFILRIVLIISCLLVVQRRVKPLNCYFGTIPHGIDPGGLGWGLEYCNFTNYEEDRYYGKTCVTLCGSCNSITREGMYARAG